MYACWPTLTLDLDENKWNNLSGAQGVEPWKSFQALIQAGDDTKCKLLATTLLTDEAAADLTDGKIVVNKLKNGKVLKISAATFKATVAKFDPSDKGLGDAKIAGLGSDTEITAAYQSAIGLVAAMEAEAEAKRAKQMIEDAEESDDEVLN